MENKNGSLFFVLFIVSVLVIIGLVFYYNTPQKSFSEDKLREIVRELEKKCEYNYLKDARLKCMKKTLIVVYGLSKWEANYYSIVIDDFATNYQIPWEIYAAIIRIESNFNGTLISPKKAKGLMQLLESTAKEEAAKIDMNYEEGQTLWNDLSNLILGCSYLSRMIKKSTLEGGVKSYLGGPAYFVNIKDNKETARYVSEYKTSVWQEYKKVSYIYRGIVSEFNVEFSKIHDVRFEVPVFVELDLFKDSVANTIFADSNFLKNDSIFSTK